jgi:hypothetical protein
VGAADAGTALDTIPEEERNLRGLELAEQHFPPERRAQVAAFLEVPAESPALLPFLAWCAANRYSPIAGHVWLIPKKIKAKDGEPERTIYKPAVGRDGLLHKARESKGKPNGYRGLKFGVVCERDTFEVEEDGSMDGPKILHRYASKPTEFAPDESPDRYRGRVIGAWAKCFVDGEPPTFYFANLREHGRLRHVWDYNPNEHSRKPIYLDAEGKKTWAEFGEGGMRNRPLQEWEGAWEYLSTMILKAAQSYVLRIALGITGIVPVDELRDVTSWKEGDTGAAVETGVMAAPEAEFDFDVLTADEELRERLRHAVETANEQEPFAWGPAKCEMVLSGRTDDELRTFVEQIERENDLREQRIAKAAGEEPVVDAEVVEEEPEEEKPAGAGVSITAAALDVGDRVWRGETLRVVTVKERDGDTVTLGFEGEDEPVTVPSGEGFMVVQGGAGGS